MLGNRLAANIHIVSQMEQQTNPTLTNLSNYKRDGYCCNKAQGILSLLPQLKAPRQLSIKIWKRHYNLINFSSMIAGHQNRLSTYYCYHIMT